MITCYHRVEKGLTWSTLNRRMTEFTLHDSRLRLILSGNYFYLHQFPITKPDNLVVFGLYS